MYNYARDWPQDPLQGDVDAERNGVRCYEPGDPLPDELRNLSLESLRLPYGLKFIDIEGKMYWTPGTREDFVSGGV